MVLVALVPLVAVLGYLTLKGIGGISWDFFTQLPKPVRETGGGMANALSGSAILVGLACLFGLPVGLLGGIYLAEYGDNAFGKAIRFCADVLSGVPSITVGIFVYTLIVLRMRRFSALAGAVTLAILMLPTIIRSTEEVVRLVPTSYRHAALALGAPQWRVLLSVVVPAAWGGIVTAIMLAVARAAGETAPLLFTALGNRFWSLSLDQPMASLPVFIFDYARAPYDDWNRQAWTGALVLLMLVATVSALMRLTTRRIARR
jgi:phosphate transport system permease protein